MDLHELLLSNSDNALGQSRSSFCLALRHDSFRLSSFVSGTVLGFELLICVAT